MDGRWLFANVLSRGELDGVDVTLINGAVVFAKENEFVDPLAENIDRLAALVKERVEISLGDLREELASLRTRVDDVECRVDDIDCRVDDPE